MTPIQKILNETASKEVDLEENNENRKEIVGKQPSLQDQILELEISFELPQVRTRFLNFHLIYNKFQIDLHFEKSVRDSLNETQSFIHISILSIFARATMKTFDIDFDAYLQDLIMVHEQFITKNNDRLRLIAMERRDNQDNDKLITINGLLTSPVNPKFSLAPYNGIENQARINISKPILLLQLEPLLSIIRYYNDIMERILKQQHYLSHKQMKNENSSPKPSPKRVVRRDTTRIMPTFQLEGQLKGLRVIIGFEFSQIFDIEIKDLQIHALNSNEKLSANLILTDFCAFDPSSRAYYRNIILRQINDKPLLRIDFSLFKYPKTYVKKLDDIDCDINIRLTKMNVVLLYKHVDLIMSLINIFPVNRTEQNDSSNQSSIVSNNMENFQKQARKLHLYVTLNTPTILIPISTFSKEGVFIDLGQWKIHTNSKDHPNGSIVEKHALTINDLKASRVEFGENHESIREVILLECAELSTSIDRLLPTETLEHDSHISIITNWDTIQLDLSKDDYVCIMKIFKRNFSEKIHHKIPKPVSTHQFRSRQTNEQKIVVANKSQNHSNKKKIQEKIYFNAEIKKIIIKLYLENMNSSDKKITRNEKTKFFDFRLEMCNAQFRQFSDASIDGKAEIQELLLFTSHETNESNSITRLISRSFNVDPKASIFTVNIEQKVPGVRQSK